MPILLGKNKGEIPVNSRTTGTINPNLDQTQYIKEQLGPKTTELINITDEEIEELEKLLQEDTKVADDENEQPSVRKRARERITENTEGRTQLEQERERLPLRERIKELFKKYGFTFATVVAAVGITIGALYQLLKNRVSAATNAIKDIF